MSDWQHYWKSICAFVVLVATNATTDLMQDGNPWPSTGAEWARWAVSILGGTLLVYGKRNLDKKPVDVGADDNPPTIPIKVPAPSAPRKRRVI